MSAISTAQSAIGYTCCSLGALCGLPGLYVSYNVGSGNPTDSMIGVIATGTSTLSIALNILGIAILCLRPSGASRELTSLTHRRIETCSGEQNSVNRSIPDILAGVASEQSNI